MTKEGLRNSKYLIIGNSAGGIGAAEAIRELDTTGSIVIISDEPYPAYSRASISKYLTKERTLQGMLFRPPDFYDENRIITLLGKRVKSLGLSEHTVELESGERISWEKLLIASGGMPIVPQIDGIGKKGVFNFLTLDDAKAIDEFLNNVNRVLIVGGGLIGISVAEALVKRGKKVVIVEMKERILNTILDERASLMAEEAVKQAGVRIICSHTVTEVAGNEWVTGAMLDSGEAISCGMVIVAIGVLPRVELVQGTSIRANRGIVVDRNMATSHPDVYACGDVAAAYDFVYDTNRLTPIWPNAYIGGRIAGRNMAGIKAEYPGGTGMNSLNYFGLDIAAAGIVIPPDDNGYECMTKEEDGFYQKLVLRNNVLVGMICIGDIEKSGIFFSLMRDRVDVGDFKQTLLDEDFGLVSLPRELWLERLGTPRPESVLQMAVPVDIEQDVAGE
jgi:NAD(P)H-nitrite reductase large subunit